MHIFVHPLLPGQRKAFVQRQFWQYVLEQDGFMSSSSCLCSTFFLVLRRLPPISMFPYGLYLQFWGIWGCLFLCAGVNVLKNDPAWPFHDSGLSVLKATEESGAEYKVSLACLCLRMDCLLVLHMWKTASVFSQLQAERGLDEKCPCNRFSYLFSWNVTTSILVLTICTPCLSSMRYYS